MYLDLILYWQLTSHLSLPEHLSIVAYNINMASGLSASVLVIGTIPAQLKVWNPCRV